MDYSAANTALWTPIIQLGYISVALLAAYGLCRVVPAIRKSMVPAAVIAGFVLLAFKLVGVVKIDSYFMEGLTYHGITIGDVVNKYYGKSYSSLVLHFVEDKKMDLDELKEIIDIIEHKDK